MSNISYPLGGEQKAADFMAKSGVYQSSEFCTLTSAPTAVRCFLSDSSLYTGLFLAVYSYFNKVTLCLSKKDDQIEAPCLSTVLVAKDGFFKRPVV